MLESRPIDVKPDELAATSWDQWWTSFEFSERAVT
jgi:hypothetical protein